MSFKFITSKRFLYNDQVYHPLLKWHLFNNWLYLVLNEAVILRTNWFLLKINFSTLSCMKPHCCSYTTTGSSGCFSVSWPIYFYLCKPFKCWSLHSRRWDTEYPTISTRCEFQFLSAKQQYHCDVFQGKCCVQVNPGKGVVQWKGLKGT